MANWLNINIQVDDTTPKEANITFNGETITIEDLGSGATIDGLTSAEIYQTIGGRLTERLLPVLQQLFDEQANTVNFIAPTTTVGEDPWVIQDIYQESLGLDNYEVLRLIDISATETSSGPYAVSDTVTWDVELTNNTGFDLTNMNVYIATDGGGTPSVVNVTSLLDGATTTTTASYTLVSGDESSIIGVGFSAEGDDPSSKTYYGRSPFYIINDFVTEPNFIQLVLESSSPPYSVGFNVTWNITVTNNTADDLTGCNYNITHNGAGTMSTISDFSLPSAQSTPVSFTYTVAAGDIGNTVDFTFQVYGTRPDSVVIVSVPFNTSVSMA